jgi:hypothetical protein
MASSDRITSQDRVTVQPYAYYGPGFIVTVNGLAVRIAGTVIFPTREAAELAATTLPITRES